jgi:hypothetical protein
MSSNLASQSTFLKNKKILLEIGPLYPKDKFQSISPSVEQSVVYTCNLKISPQDSFRYNPAQNINSPASFLFDLIALRAEPENGVETENQKNILQVEVILSTIDASCSLGDH